MKLTNLELSNMEIFKDIKGYEGLYQISNLGNVKSLERLNDRGNKLKEKILKAGLTSGYLLVTLSKNVKQKSYRVHQLVAITFLNHTPNWYKIVVDHKNAIKTDNRLENLQLITFRENLSKDKKGSSKYTGVSWNKLNKNWVAQITINNERIYLGSFTCQIEAHNEYQKALKKHLNDSL